MTSKSPGSLFGPGFPSKRELGVMSSMQSSLLCVLASKGLLFARLADM